MRKKNDIPVIENFEITGVAAEGKSLGRWNDLVVFVPFGRALRAVRRLQVATPAL